MEKEYLKHHEKGNSSSGVVKCCVGDTVRFKGRKWLYFGNVSGKAMLRLMPNQKPYYQNNQEVNMITTKDVANLKHCK